MHNIFIIINNVLLHSTQIEPRYSNPVTFPMFFGILDIFIVSGLTPVESCVALGNKSTLADVWERLRFLLNVNKGNMTRLWLQVTVDFFNIKKRT